MEQTNTSLAVLPKKLQDVAANLNKSVMSVISSEQMVGFEKAYLIAIAAGQLKESLTAEYMKPIMELQGNRLGFKTDKDSTGGYKEAEVKNCLIEAVLTGVQPFGNQFNIIAGNCYITKEGFGYLLKNMTGLSYEIVPSLPRINQDKSSAAIIMKVRYSMNGSPIKEQELDIPVKMNNFMGTDAVIGKATRKARAWLFNTLTGSEIADGDITDMDNKNIPIRGTTLSVEEIAEEKENQRITDFINNAQDITQLNDVETFLITPEHRTLFDQKAKELNNGTL